MFVLVVVKTENGEFLCPRHISYKMAYGYRRYSRSSYRTRRPRYRRNRVTPGVRRYVKRVVSAAEETKYLDIDVTTTASSTTFGAVNIAGAIAQGTSRSNRIGSKIKVIGVRYLIELTAGDNENVCRLLLLQYKPGGNGPATISAIPSLIGPVNTDTYRPMFDRIAEPHFAPVDGNSGSTISVNRYYRGYIKMNKMLNFGTGSQPVTDSMYIQLHSDSLAVPNPGIRGFVRIYFKDA